MPSVSYVRDEEDIKVVTGCSWAGTAYRGLQKGLDKE
jgi:hypothetical protein